MSTLLLSHPASLEHRTPEGHPERPDRIRAIEAALSHEMFAALKRDEAPTARDGHLLLCHTNELLDQIHAALPTSGEVYLDADTVLSPGSWEAAMRAAGGAVAAVDAVFEGRARNAFVSTRPPGHHAEHDKAMGFCFFNNAGIAARHAQRQYGAERVAIIDWDVHHGNGTQDIFWADRSVLYASTHQMPLYPGTGRPSERGEHDTVINIALQDGDGSEAFREAFRAGIIPRVDAFKPDLIVISAGFDAHHLDPLGGLQLTEQDFGWATLQLMAIADARANGRVVSVLEGGYSLKGLASSVNAHVQALMQG